MLLQIKYFYENTDADKEEYDKLWEANRNRFIFLQTGLGLSQQIDSIQKHIDEHKDVLAIRFPTNHFMRNNKIVNHIILGKGFAYNNGAQIWYPAEIWIYHLLQ